MPHAHHDIPLPPEPDGRAFVVGRDETGHWVAVEVHGSGGGLFVSQAAALRYAGAETGRRPGAVHAAPGPIHLDWSGESANPTGF